MGEFEDFMNEKEKIPVLKLSREELLLIDWILTYPMPNMQVDLDWHMRWKQVRLTVWNKIIHMPPIGEDTVELSKEDVETMLCMTPTTFRWGRNPEDCGYSLKVKLAKYLLGEVEEEDANKNNTENKTETTGETTGGSVADS